MATMSDSKSKSTKTEAKADNKTEAKADNKTESKPSDTSATSSSDNVGKSARESVGGAAVGHYGFFSNIKTPEYKSGWDDIWGNEKKSSGKKKSAPKSKAQIFVGLDLEELPPEVRDGLEDAVRSKLKKKRISYDARQKKDDVNWTIGCEVRR